MDQRIITGDALEQLKTIPDRSVDLIVTDPPYNLNKDYGLNKDNLEFEEYLAFTRAWLQEANRVLRDGGSIYICMGMRFISYLYQILEQELGYAFNSWITWHYTQGMGKTRGFSSRHEDVLFFTKGKNFHFDLNAIRVPQKYYRSVNNMRGANPGNVWSFSHIHYCQKGRTAHPTQKPEALFERMILASSKPGDVVLDPFCGSGTALSVCQQTGRQGIGIEINPEYVSLIEQRLAQPFVGFDSADERIFRCPNDLNDPTIRLNYLNHHVEWFLANHQDRLNEFLLDVKAKYEKKMKEADQLDFFAQFEPDVQ